MLEVASIGVTAAEYVAPNLVQEAVRVAMIRYLQRLIAQRALTEAASELGQAGARSAVSGWVPVVGWAVAIGTFAVRAYSVYSIVSLIVRIINSLRGGNEIPRDLIEELPENYRQEIALAEKEARLQAQKELREQAQRKQELREKTAREIAQRQRDLQKGQLKRVGHFDKTVVLRIQQATDAFEADAQAPDLEKPQLTQAEVTPQGLEKLAKLHTDRWLAKLQNRLPNSEKLLGMFKILADIKRQITSQVLAKALHGQELRHGSKISRKIGLDESLFEQLLNFLKDQDWNKEFREFVDEQKTADADPLFGASPKFRLCIADSDLKQRINAKLGEEGFSGNCSWPCLKEVGFVDAPVDKMSFMDRFTGAWKYVARFAVRVVKLGCSKAPLLQKAVDLVLNSSATAYRTTGPCDHGCSLKTAGTLLATSVSISLGEVIAMYVGEMSSQLQQFLDLILSITFQFEIYLIDRGLHSTCGSTTADVEAPSPHLEPPFEEVYLKTLIPRLISCD